MARLVIVLVCEGKIIISHRRRVEINCDRSCDQYGASHIRVSLDIFNM